MPQGRLQDRLAQQDTPPVRIQALRRSNAALNRLIKRYESELRRAVPPDARDQPGSVLAETEVNGTRYLLLKVRSASSRALTDRQLQVALFVADGLSNKEVGRELSISAATVAAHLRLVYKKLNVMSRTGILPALLHTDRTATAPEIHH